MEHGTQGAGSGSYPTNASLLSGWPTASFMISHLFLDTRSRLVRICIQMPQRDPGEDAYIYWQMSGVWLQMMRLPSNSSSANTVT